MKASPQALLRPNTGDQCLVLSTMIPSLVNLVIDGTSPLRGLPRVPSLLLRYIPERGGVLKWDRHWIATVLTTQVAAGPRGGRLQSAGAGGAALRGKLVAALFGPTQS